MILTYKYRLKGKRAERQLRRFAWAANQVWNYCVQTQRKVQRTWKDGLSAKWPSHFTTQTCSTTGIIPPESPKGIAGLGVREWECSACGEIHDRDVNAAQNILVFGLSALTSSQPGTVPVSLLLRKAGLPTGVKPEKHA